MHVYIHVGEVDEAGKGQGRGRGRERGNMHEQSRA